MPVGTKERVDFGTFRKQVEEVVFRHPVVTDNTYTRWFAKGEATREEVRHLTVQFSVFSHEFCVAALRRVINARDLESYRAAKEILMNELGVIYRKPGEKIGDEFVTPDKVGTEGSVNGSRFFFQAAHFEWLVDFAKPLGLTFSELGKRRFATPSTLFFCDELIRTFGSEDPSFAEGAGFAIENWAAAGFWKELIAGLEAFKRRECPELPLGFFTWHDRIEDQHKAHVWDELEEAFKTPGFSAERFFEGARELLDAVKVFWDGLWRDHLSGFTGRGFTRA